MDHVADKKKMGNPTDLAGSFVTVGVSATVTALSFSTGRGLDEGTSRRERIASIKATGRFVLEKETGAATCAAKNGAGNAARWTRVSQAAGLDGLDIGRGGRGKGEETNSVDESDKGEEGGVRRVVDRLRECLEGSMRRSDGTKTEKEVEKCEWHKETQT